MRAIPSPQESAIHTIEADQTFSNIWSSQRMSPGPSLMFSKGNRTAEVMENSV